MTEIVTTEIVAYNEFRAQLAELKEYNDKAVFDYETPKGNKDARSHVYKLRKTKTAVEACRKAEKKASLEYGRQVDGEAKEIFGEIEEMISVHETPLLQIENLEKQRVTSILDCIEVMRGAAEDTDGRSAEVLRDRLHQIKAEEITSDIFQEFTEQAIGAKSLAISTMERIIAEQQKREDDQAELERLRKETAERAQKDRDERIAKEAAERATKEAEQAAKRQQEKAERAAEQLRIDKAIAVQAKKDAEERAIQAQEKAKERAIQAEKDAKQRAANAAKETESRLIRESEAKKKAEADAQAKREANTKHLAKINNAAVNALICEAMLTEEQARTVVALIANRVIPNVSIRY